MKNHGSYELTDLRGVMRRWVSGVAILTAGNQVTRRGLTVNSFTSVSVDPPAVTVTLANQAKTRQVLEENGCFVIHLLREDQVHLSDLFAGRIPEEGDRFASQEVFYGELGLPILADAAAYLVCRVIHRYEMTNSTLYIGEVLSAHKTENAPPLVYSDREYRRLMRWPKN